MYDVLPVSATARVLSGSFVQPVHFWESRKTRSLFPGGGDRQVQILKSVRAVAGTEVFDASHSETVMLEADTHAEGIFVVVARIC